MAAIQNIGQPGNFLTGTPGQTKQFQNFSPQQQGLQNNILSQLVGMLGNVQNRQPAVGKTFDFSPIEKQARINFTQNTLPGIAERFTSLGDGGQNSSAYQGVLGSAAAGLDTNLAALKAQYDYNSHNQQQQFGLQERGQENDLLSRLLGIGFQPSFNESYIPRQPGLIENGISNAFGGLQGGGLAALLSLLGIGGSTSNNGQQRVSNNGYRPEVGQFESRFGGNYLGSNQ